MGGKQVETARETHKKKKKRTKLLPVSKIQGVIHLKLKLALQQVLYVFYLEEKTSLLLRFTPEKREGAGGGCEARCLYPLCSFTSHLVIRCKFYALWLHDVN